MEPMTLGSPTHAHSHHNVQPSHSGQFLPGYLMGDPMPSVSPSSSRVWSRSTSPTKSMTPSTLGTRDSSSIPGRLDRTDGRTPRTSVSHTPKGKDGAPPVAGLFDNVDSLKGSPAIGLGTSYVGTPDPLNFSQHGIPSSPLPRTPRTPVPPLHMSGTPRGSTLFSPSHQTSQIQFGLSQPPSSPAQIDPFYTQGEAITPEDQFDETWVTVFGFPPAATSFILQQFSQYGSICKHVVASSGNWMHLQYSSKIQAKKALSKNGKVLGGSIMIGVRPCIDKGVMEGREGDATTSFVTSPPIGTPNRSLSLRTSSTGSQESDTQKNTPIRPLTAAYRAASSNHEVLQDGGTPQKSANIVSKTLEYMFGW